MDFKPYQNIVSEKESCNQYYVISDYDTLEEAKENFDNDRKKFEQMAKSKLDDTPLNKLWLHCLHYWTICDKTCLV